MRNRDLLIKKLFPSISKQDGLSEFRKSAHVAIKINNIYFIDLAGIEGLSHKENRVVETIT